MLLLKPPVLMHSWRYVRVALPSFKANIKLFKLFGKCIIHREHKLFDGTLCETVRDI